MGRLASCSEPFGRHLAEAVDGGPRGRHSVGMTEVTDSQPTMSRPGQYWHVHECRWVRYAEPDADQVVVPEQPAAVEQVDAPAVTG